MVLTPELRGLVLTPGYAVTRAYRRCRKGTKTMSRKFAYLILTVIGFILPYYFLISFLITHGLAARLFLNQLFGTPISTFFATDLLISCVVFMIFLRREAERQAMKYQWVYWISLLTVGLSFALPLFLWVREGHLESGRGDK
jgi:hypothetical protein